MLDDKLREILLNFPLKGGDTVAQIKQAFVDEEWIPQTASAGFRARYNIMTGQEWYDKFEKEYKNGSRETWEYKYIPIALEAAKRAAGLDG